MSVQMVLNILKKDIRLTEGHNKRCGNMVVRGSLLIVPSKEQERRLFFLFRGYEYAPVEK
jgi:hypothetical protein